LLSLPYYGDAVLCEVYTETQSAEFPLENVIILYVRKHNTIGAIQLTSVVAKKGSNFDYFLNERAGKSELSGYELTLCISMMKYLSKT
jgi:hypothetical protein